MRAGPEVMEGGTMRSWKAYDNDTESGYVQVEGGASADIKNCYLITLLINYVFYRRFYDT